MKTLLINLPVNLDNRHDFETKIHPYGLAIISAYLKKYGCDVVLFDAQAYQSVRIEILNLVEQVKPNIIGLSCMTFQLATILSFANEVKQKYPNVKIILGGVHASAEPLSTLEATNNIDFICMGEGEMVMLELITSLRDGQGYEDIDGLGFINNGEVTLNHKQQMIKDLDALPFADWESLPMEKYWDSLTIKKNHATTFASRGCPFPCTFCAAPVVMGKKVRKRSPENIVEEIALLHDKYGVRDLLFGDSTFNVDKRWVNEVCEAIIRLNRDIIWRCSIRADCIDKETIKLMKQSGCIQVSMGIESGDPEMLKLMKKGESFEKIKKGMAILKELKMPADHGFILGMPGETMESVKKTIKLAKSVSQIPSFSIATPLPGTPFYEQAKQEGLSVKDWSNFDCYSITYVPKGMTRKELEEAYRMTIRQITFHPKYLLKRLFQMRSLLQLQINLRYAWRIICRGLNIGKKADYN